MKKVFLISVLLLTSITIFARDCRMLVASLYFYDEEIAEFVDWKNKLGYKVDTLKIPYDCNYLEIDSLIGQRISTYDSLPEYLVLFGSDFSLPLGPFGSFATDVYYADRDRDSIADIVVSRVPGIGDDFVDYTQRVLNYEKSPWLEGDSTWFLKATLATSLNHGDTIMAPYWDCLFHADSLMQMNDFAEIDTIFCPRTDIIDDCSDELSDSYADGRGYIMFRGEGSEGWGGYYFFNTMFLDLNRTTPVMSGFTCGTLSRFGNYWISPYEAPQSGAIAYAGMATSAEDSRLTDLRNAAAYGFSEGIFNGIDLGHAIQMGRDNILEYDYDIATREYFSAQLYGDPTLKIWKKNPQYFEVNHREHFIFGENTDEIEVSCPEGPVENALVCIMHKFGVYEYGYTNADGNISFSYNVDRALVSDMDTIYVTVSAADFIPYEGFMTYVIEGARPHIYSRTINDSITGSGDGFLMNHEPVYLDLDIINIGTEIAEDVTIWIEPISECVTFNDTSYNIELLALGDTIRISECFLMTVMSETRNADSIVYNIFMNCDDDTFVYRIDTDELLYASFAYRDNFYDPLPGGNADGIFKSGEEISLQFTLANYGTVSAENLEISFLSDDYLYSLDTTTIYVPCTLSIGSYDDTVRIPAARYIVRNSFDGIINCAPHFLITHSQDGFGEYSTDFNYQIELESYVEQSSGDGSWYFIYDDHDTLTGMAPSYTWNEEISEGLGAAHTEFRDDDVEYITIPMPINYRFYGDEYDEITIFENGYIIPGVSDHVFTNPEILPDRGFPIPILAPCWANLSCEEPGNIFTYHDEEHNTFTIEYHKLTDSFGDTISCQMVIHEPEFLDSMQYQSEIYIYYKSFGLGYSKGVALQNEYGYRGTYYMINNTYAHGALEIDSTTAIRITNLRPPMMENPFMLVNSAHFSDSEFGNGDGEFTEGERITGTFDIHNQSEYPGENLTLTLDLYELYSSSEIVDGSGYISEISPGEIIETDTFSFIVDNIEASGFDLNMVAILNITDSLLFSQTLNYEIPISWEGISERKPMNYEIVRTYPNPFNTSMNFEIHINETQNAKIEIYTANGRLIQNMNLGKLDSGYHIYKWNAGNLESGVYFYRLLLDGKTAQEGKTILIK